MGQFNSVPLLDGFYFGNWSREIFRGGKLEAPHVHVGKGRNKEAGKIWSADENTGSVAVVPSKSKGISTHEYNKFEKHIEKYKNKCYDEWDAWIVKDKLQSLMNPKELEKFNERQRERGKEEFNPSY